MIVEVSSRRAIDFSRSSRPDALHQPLAAQPNARAVHPQGPRRVLRLRAIAVGEEITVDYGETHHEGRLKCRCGAPDCVGATLRRERLATAPARPGRGRDNRRMNPLLQRLHPYPFERLRELTRDIAPNPRLRAISLGIGEPRHATPRLVEEALVQGLGALSSYPATAGDIGAARGLRAVAAAPLRRRASIPRTQVLPVNGTREALFAFAQTVLDPIALGRHRRAARIRSTRSTRARRCWRRAAGVRQQRCRRELRDADWDDIDERTWSRTQLLYVCSPGNPTGAVMPLDEWRRLFELSDRHGFVIASDECYSEIYFARRSPAGRPAGRRAAGARRLPRPRRRSRACPSAATCPACVRASSPATPR